MAGWSLCMFLGIIHVYTMQNLQGIYMSPCTCTCVHTNTYMYICTCIHTQLVYTCTCIHNRCCLFQLRNPQHTRRGSVAHTISQVRGIFPQLLQHGLIDSAETPPGPHNKDCNISVVLDTYLYMYRKCVVAYISSCDYWIHV